MGALSGVAKDVLRLSSMLLGESGGVIMVVSGVVIVMFWSAFAISSSVAWVTSGFWYGWISGNV